MQKKHLIRLASFGLPVLLSLILMAVLHVYPFGDATFLIWDMDWQYSSFFAHLHDILHGEASAWYSFSRAIGGDMVGVSAYYLISPFNLLFYFFDAAHIYAGIALVLLLKIGCTGWTMQYYLESKKRMAGNLIFSTAYALSGFMVAYFFNIIWLDGIYVLPLMILGIERLIDKRKPFLYLFCIAYGVLTSFYIGYMLCIFSVLYFICYYFFLSEGRKRIGTLFVYAGSSLLGGMLSAVTALPALYAMRDGKTSIDSAVWENHSAMFGLKDFIEKSFAGTIESLQITEGEPLLYAGVLSVIFLIIFFLDGRNGWKKKIGYGMLLVFMGASLYFYNLCCAWQAFNMPNGSQFRYAFLYVFVVLILAAEEYRKFYEPEQMDGEKAEKIRDVVAVVLLLAGMFLVKGKLEDLDRKGVFLCNLLLLAGYLGILLCVKNRQIRTGMFLAGMSAELLANALLFYQNTPLYTSTTVSEYQTYIENTQELVKQVKEDSGLYRTVLTGDAYRTVNDGFLWNLYGLDSYTSVESEATQQMAFNLGYYRNMIQGIHYKDGSTLAAESFLGVKYLLTSKEVTDSFKELGKSETVRLYENQDALPVAFFVKDTMKQVENEDFNCFAYQDAIYQNLLTGQAQDIFTQAVWEPVEYVNCEQTGDGSLWITDPKEESYVDYRLHITEKSNYYIQYLGSHASKVIAFIDGEEMDLGEQPNVVKRLGTLDEADDVILRCYISGEEAHTLEKVYVYSENEEALQQYAKEVCAQNVEIFHKRDDKITVRCKREEDGTGYLMCTIPYDRGWKIKVDGQKVTAEQVLGNYLLIPVESGEHEIVMQFVPQGLYPGAAITACAVLIVCVAVVWGKIKKINYSG